MKFFFGLCAIVFGAIAFGSSPTEAHQNLLGSKKCSRGPGYWCENIKNAKECYAVRHCIQTIWESHEVPEDTDSVCQICKDMVTQARDQLKSNETIDLIKQVFDGSCRLIPIPPVANECVVLAENFIPELIETLSSEMNPDQVCSVAGLCNNAEIDKVLNDYYRQALKSTGSFDINSIHTTTTTTEKARLSSGHKSLSCANCNDISKTIVSKFHSTSRDHISDSLLDLCGQMSSFVDACQNIVLVHFNDIYNNLKNNLSPDGICHMSGVCAGNYHKHPEGIEVQTKSDVGFVPVKKEDDLPCEMCEQLVHHLRDLLVANTTELEFKQVLEGLCNQTKGFKDECISMVDQYYAVIYNELVNNLDANEACFMIGVCPKGSQIVSNINGVLPLLSMQNQQQAEKSITTNAPLGANEPVFTQEEIANMQLPIDRLMGAANPTLLVQNGQLCTVCEYFLHFVQETLASPDNERKIRETVENVCKKVPKSFGSECKDFVEVYGDAIIALLIQDLTPRDVCPKLEMCTKTPADMEVFSHKQIVHTSELNKATCPLCLLAVAQAQALVQTNKSKDNIRNVLSNLCNHLPDKEYKLKEECVDFIKTYSDELEDKLISDFTPQEICVDLKLCTDKRSFIEKLVFVTTFKKHYDDEEEIDSSDTVDDIVTLEETAAAPNCLLCEEVIKVAEKKYIHQKSKDEIIRALKTSCGKLKVNAREECFKYIDKYGDKIADLILREMSPKLICREIGLCSEPEDLEIDEAVKYVSFMPAEDDIIFNSVDETVKDPQCILCEFVMSKIEAEVNTHETDIETTVKSVCSVMPKTVHTSCTKFIDQYAKTLIALLETVPPKEICRQIQQCLTGFDNTIKDDVIECGVCHGATLALTKYFTESKTDTLDNHALVNTACADIPSKYYELCSEMVSVYGISMKNLIKSETDTDQSKICAKIGKCFDNENPVAAFVQMIGPVVRARRNDLVGNNPCTYGPSYWCANEQNAKECGTTEFCLKKFPTIGNSLPWVNSNVTTSE